MRKFFMVALAATTVAITGCADEFDDGGYGDVYEGVVIYNDALISRVLATDGVSIALRLAVLLDELDMTVGTGFESDEPDYSTELLKYTVDGTDYDRRELLIGSTNEVSISRDGDYYTIKYYNENYTTKHISADFDFCRRNGSFVINTNGVELLETDSSTKWDVTFADEDGDNAKMTYATSYSYEYGGDVNAKATSCRIYKDGDNKFTIEGSINAGYMDDEEYYPYKVTGYITIGDSALTELTLENTIGVSTSLYLTTSSGDSHDTISGLPIQYTTTTPLVYSPTNYGIYSISGVEWAKYDNASSAGYAANSVTVTSNSDASRKISYNGHSYTWAITGGSW